MARAGGRRPAVIGRAAGASILRALTAVVQPSQVRVGGTRRDAQRFRAREVLNSPMIAITKPPRRRPDPPAAGRRREPVTGPRSQGRQTPMAAFQTLLGIEASLPPTTYQEIKDDAFATAELTG
jgi:hypothetical protein